MPAVASRCRWATCSVSVNLKEEVALQSQAAAAQRVCDGRRRAARAPARPPDDESPPRLRLELAPQAALIAIDVRSRDIVALVGSEEALPGGLDRARRAHRQPGSSFKPIVFGYALRSHLVTPASVLELEHPGRGVSEVPPYRTSVRNALAQSNNEAAVELLREGGPAQVVAFAHELGIESKLGADLSLALGSYEVTPLEMANAFATFASGGMQQEPRLLSELRAPSGEPLPLPQRPPAAPRAVRGGGLSGHQLATKCGPDGNRPARRWRWGTPWPARPGPPTT